MSIYIPGMEMPKACITCPFCQYWEEPTSLADTDPFQKVFLVCGRTHSKVVGECNRLDDCPLVPVPEHGRLINADALTKQMVRNLWAIEDKAEKELGFDETLRRGMQYGHAVCLNAVNDASVIFVPQIVRCCECEHNNHCLTQEFVKEESKIPFDENTWFCADAKAAPTIIPADNNADN